MRAILTRELLLGVIKLASAATLDGQPQYENLLIQVAPTADEHGEVTGGELRVWGASYDLTISAGIPLDEGWVEGSCVVNARRLLAVVQAQGKATEFDLEQIEPDWLHVRAGRFRIRLHAFDPIEFRLPTTLAAETEFEIAGAELGAMLGAVKHAAATEANLWAMRGVCLRQDGRKLIAAATDQARLSEAVAPLPAGSGAMPSVTLPLRLVKELETLCQAGKVRLSVNRIAVMARAGSVMVRGQLLDSQFPDYTPVVARWGGDGAMVEIDRTELLEAVASVAAVADKKRHVDMGVRLELLEQDESWALVAVASSGGQRAEDWLSVKEPRFISDADCSDAVMAKGGYGLGVSFLLQALQALQSDDVTLFLPTDKAKPVGLSTAEPPCRTFISPRTLPSDRGF